MIIVMQGDASPQQIERVMERIQDLGYKPHPIVESNTPLSGPLETNGVKVLWKVW